MKLVHAGAGQFPLDENCRVIPIHPGCLRVIDNVTGKDLDTGCLLWVDCQQGLAKRYVKNDHGGFVAVWNERLQDYEVKYEYIRGSFRIVVQR